MYCKATASQSFIKPQSQSVQSYNVKREEERVILTKEMIRVRKLSKRLDYSYIYI